MRHLSLILFLPFLFWSCAEKSSSPGPVSIPSPDIDINDTALVEDAFLVANPTWVKKDGDLPATSGSSYISVALYDTLECFNGRQITIGFNNYLGEVPEGFYVRIPGSNTYFVVPSDENLRKGLNSEKGQSLIKGNPLVLENKISSESTQHPYDNLYFLKAVIPSSIKPGNMDIEFKAFFSNGDVSDARTGQIKIFQLGEGTNSSPLIKRSWNIEKMTFNQSFGGIQELIFGSEQTVNAFFTAYCNDGSVENVLVEVTYTYTGGMTIGANGSYNSYLNLRARTAEFINWDCGDPINYVDVDDLQKTKGGWGLSDDGKFLIYIIDPYFDEDGYYYVQRTYRSKILQTSFDRLVLREYDMYNPAYYTDIVLGN